MTDQEVLDYVYLHLGGERKSGLLKPMVLAMATLALKDLAEMLIETNSELAKKLVVSVANQTWANSSFAAPANMLFHKQKKTTRMSFTTTLAYQVTDRDRLDMADGTMLDNIYYALEGKTFFIKHPTLTGSNNLNLTYYKIPAVTEIDTELAPLFLEILMRRLLPQHKKATEPPKE